MSTRLRMLVIAVMTIGACVSVRPYEPVLDADAGTDVQRPRMVPVSMPMEAGTSQLPRDAGRSQEPPDTDLDAESGDDTDSGVDELAADIALDCTETLRCNPMRLATVPNCIKAVTESLSTSPEGRARFVAIISPCRTLRGCEYVSCVERSRP